MQSAHHGQVWRSLAGTTAAYLLVDLGASYSIGGVYLGNHNLSGSGTWRVRLSTADATGATGDAHDSTATATGISTEYRLAVRIFSAAATGRYLRIDLSDATLTHLEVGRLWAGTVFKPTRNFQFGAQRGYIDNSRRSRGSDGQDWVTRGSRQRYVRFTLGAVTTAEAEASGEVLSRTAGTSSDVLVCLDSAATNIGRQTYLGLLDEVPAWEMAFPGIEAASFQVVQRL